MHLTKSDIESKSKVDRLNLINAVSGVKPANLIGTICENKYQNLAIFSSIVHLGSHPAILGFILRPNQAVRRHTYENILETGYYTINHVHTSIAAQAHFTSAKFEKETSEFEKCGLTPEFIADFGAPFVKESRLKMGMKYLESVPISINNTIMVVGEIEHLILPEHAMDENGYIDLNAIDSVGISGLNTYYKLEKMETFPYARTGNLPNFER
jgi:flavin reductase (DIM6/NTAB) family NADH-FMN oxidoreductase RutF